MNNRGFESSAFSLLTSVLAFPAFQTPVPGTLSPRPSCPSAFGRLSGTADNI